MKIVFLKKQFKRKNFSEKNILNTKNFLHTCLDFSSNYSNEKEVCFTNSDQKKTVGKEKCVLKF